MKKYTVSQDFVHGRQSYHVGNPAEFHPLTGEALKSNGLLIDYSPPNPPEPGRESSASRPGRVSRKQTAS
jgi:hypothetical protein